MKLVSRRNLMLSAIIGGTALYFYRAAPNLKELPIRKKTLPAPNPHFFIQLHFRGGIDQSYLFDARPLEMTNAKKIQNFLGEEARELVGINGQKTLTKSLIDPLNKHMSDLSVINGVFMSSQFDGHIENNTLLSGSECSVKI